MNTEEQIAQKSAEQFLAIKNGTEGELAAIIRNAIEKATQPKSLLTHIWESAAAQPQRSVHEYRGILKGVIDGNEGAAISEPPPQPWLNLPCGCTIEKGDNMKSSVFWNEFNRVVQCHKCGQLYEPVKAVNSEPQEWTPEGVRRLREATGSVSMLDWDDAIAYAHKAALAAARDEWNDEHDGIVMGLHKELAAERERLKQAEAMTLDAHTKADIWRKQVEPLVEALELALHEMRHTTAPRNSFTEAVDKIDAALASVKDVMDYDTGLV